MKKAILFALILCPIAASAQFLSVKASKNIPDNAICYSLPATQFDIAVTVRTTTEKPGEYARYAERYLGIKDVITAESTNKEIIDIHIVPRTVADNEHCYYLIPASSDKKISPYMPTLYLTEEGILKAVNTKPVDKADKSGRYVKTAPSFKNKGSHKVYPTLTSEMLQASSSMKMAELAAKQIFALRDTRLALLQGELEHTPADGEAMKLYLTELQRMEQSYTELFTGSHNEVYETVHVTYQPLCKGSGETAFRFSAQKGVVPATDLSGAPVTLTVTPLEGSDISQESASQVDAPIGIYYYIPRQSNVEISYNRQTVYQEKMCVAQAGILMNLPAAPQLKAIFLPASGALMAVSK